MIARSLLFSLLACVSFDGLLGVYGSGWGRKRGLNSNDNGIYMGWFAAVVVGFVSGGILKLGSIS